MKLSVSTQTCPTARRDRCLIRILGVGLVVSCLAIGASEGSENLVELSCESFGEGGQPKSSAERPFLRPPELKFFANGFAVQRSPSGGYFSAQLDPSSLESVKQLLADSEFLAVSGLLTPRKTEYTNHGGMCYVRVGEPPNEIVVATAGIPRSRWWKRFRQDLAAAIPDNCDRYIPKSLSVIVTDDYWRHRQRWGDVLDWPRWPFEEELSLADALNRGPQEVAAPEVVRYLLDRTSNGALRWYYSQSGSGFGITVVEAGSWYQPLSVGERIVEQLTSP